MVEFSLDDAVLAGALQYVADYSAAPGGFVGSGASVECTGTAGDFVTFNDAEATSELNAAYVSLSGFMGPTLVAQCNFQQVGPTAPVPGDFIVTVTDASDPGLNPIVPTPVVSVAIP